MRAGEVYRRGIGSYDAYLVHASEDAAQADRLVVGLRAQGFTVWFNSFLVGPSIRDQMDVGLTESDFGVVLISPNFFAKKWSRNELDALFGLEAPGEVRILPVWLGVTEADVRAQSPMLAGRAAAIWKADDPDQVVTELIQSILELSVTRSPGRRLRSQIATGFPWVRPPVFMAKSLAEYDAKFPEQFALTELVSTPQVPQRGVGQPTHLIELMRAHPLWDGQRMTSAGHLLDGKTQVFEELVPGHMLPQDPSRSLGVGIAAYVFSSLQWGSNTTSFAMCTVSGRTRKGRSEWGRRRLRPLGCVG